MSCKRCENFNISGGGSENQGLDWNCNKAINSLVRKPSDVYEIINGHKGCVCPDCRESLCSWCGPGKEKIKEYFQEYPDLVEKEVNKICNNLKEYLRKNKYDIIERENKKKRLEKELKDITKQLKEIQTINSPEEEGCILDLMQEFLTNKKAEK